MATILIAPEGAPQIPKSTPLSPPAPPRIDWIDQRIIDLVRESEPVKHWQVLNRVAEDFSPRSRTEGREVRMKLLPRVRRLMRVGLLFRAGRNAVATFKPTAKPLTMRTRHRKRTANKAISAQMNVWKSSVLTFPFDPTDKQGGAFKGFALRESLWWRNFWTDDPVDGMKYYGLVCDTVDPCRNLSDPLACDITGLGYGDEAWGVFQSDTLHGSIMPHEIAHTLLPGAWIIGYPRHVRDNCGSNGSSNAGGPFFEDYPNQTGLINGRGFDGATVYGGDPRRSPAYYDIMTYCDPQWMSAYIYQMLFSELSSASRLASPAVVDRRRRARPGLQGPPGRILAITGAVNKQDEVEWHRCQVLESQRPLSEPPESETEYSVQIRDSGGAILFSNAVPVLRDASSGEAGFAHVVPCPVGTAIVTLLRGEKVLGSRKIGGARPTVRVIQPNGGENLSGEVRISWSASDPDGDPLEFDLLVSTDGGIQWSAIATAVRGEEWTWDSKGSRGSNRALLRIIATDGVNTGQDDSDRLFRLQKGSPEVEILEPSSASRRLFGSPITLDGYGYDPEDGPLAAEFLVWHSSADGDLGSGRSVTVPALSAGRHEITLTGKDRDGNKSSASVLIEIAPRIEIASEGNGVLKISWAPDAIRFVLQVSDRLDPPAWVEAASRGANPVTVTIGESSRFFRLMKR